MTTGARRRVRDKDGKQRALLEAAAEVFAEAGYAAAATKEIARRADCSEAMLFHYFGDKRGIFEQVVSRQIADLVSEAEEQVVADLPPRLEDYIERLFFARLRVDDRESDVPGWDISSRALSDPDFSLRVLQPNHARRTAVIAEGVRHYQAAGQIRADVDADLFAELLANFIIFTTSLGPRWFGTAESDIRAQIELGSQILAKGVSTSTTKRPAKRSGRVQRSPKVRAAD
ncbi:TetR family transcriptional regulator [Cupriavidus necator N-1] [Mycobacterium shimoidei]|uniref:TetR family transcriptional regulator [Cupriavidus necator N-1] n=1 Tax=Mycobacterium shimoidei TaxID=29313 RepID=A0A375Z0R5_MYCSH|nr:TetR/AcrR family transcriptional regulator [Mycobacterium shimoidei]SRX94738.1 TetR family transcriptional regulator [Cupriavidus necator N-1] [Mycobacterium shimoidei]